MMRHSIMTSFSVGRGELVFGISPHAKGPDLAGCHNGYYGCPFLRTKSLPNCILMQFAHRSKYITRVTWLGVFTAGYRPAFPKTILALPSPKLATTTTIYLNVV